MRDLPVELAKALRDARALEDLARAHGGREAERRAVHATSALAFAAAEVGWFHSEIAAVLGLNRQTLTARLEQARELYGDDRPALVVDEPLRRLPGPRSRPVSPVAERQWLTRREAAAVFGVHEYTIRNWYWAGLLPNTRTDRTPHLLLCADLERVVAADPYRGRGVDYAKLRARIDAVALSKDANSPRPISFKLSWFTDTH